MYAPKKSHTANNVFIFSKWEELNIKQAYIYIKWFISGCQSYTEPLWLAENILGSEWFWALLGILQLLVATSQANEFLDNIEF